MNRREKSEMRVRKDILIREIHPLDYEGLKGFLERNNTSETTRHFHPFPLTAETAKWITSSSKQDGYYLALFGNQVVGLCMLRGGTKGSRCLVLALLLIMNLSVGVLEG